MGLSQRSWIHLSYDFDAKFINEALLRTSEVNGFHQTVQAKCSQAAGNRFKLRHPGCQNKPVCVRASVHACERACVRACLRGTVPKVVSLSVNDGSLASEGAVVSAARSDSRMRLEPGVGVQAMKSATLNHFDTQQAFCLSIEHCFERNYP